MWLPGPPERRHQAREALGDMLDHWLDAGPAYLMIEGGWPLDLPASSSEAWSTILYTLADAATAIGRYSHLARTIAPADEQEPPSPRPPGLQQDRPPRRSSTDRTRPADRPRHHPGRGRRLPAGDRSRRRRTPTRQRRARQPAPGQAHVPRGTGRVAPRRTRPSRREDPQPTGRPSGVPALAIARQHAATPDGRYTAPFRFSEADRDRSAIASPNSLKLERTRLQRALLL
jgi:hypothetical protein